MKHQESHWSLNSLVASSRVLFVMPISFTLKRDVCSTLHESWDSCSGVLDVLVRGGLVKELCRD